MEKASLEKEKETPKAKTTKREVWDCGSSLYDSFELKSLQLQLHSAISGRTMSMPHLSSSTHHRQPPLPPPPHHYKPTAKKHSRISRSLHRLLRSIFRPKQNHSSSREGAYYVYDTSGALSTIPEVPEMLPEFDGLSPEMKSLVTRTGSDRFMPASSLGISCA